MFRTLTTTAARAMAKPKILLTRFDFPQEALDKLRKVLDVDLYEGTIPMPRPEMLARVAGKEGVLCLLTDCIDAELLDAAGPSLKAVSTMSAGYDHISVEEAKRRNIKVGYTPGILTDASAELTVSLLLATSRRLLEANVELKNGGWLERLMSPMWLCGRGLAGSTVGIFGLGRIGQGVLKRLAGFNVAKFLYCGNTKKDLDDSFPPAEMVSFESMLEQSDFVVVTAALTDSTKGKFDRKAFAMMKKTAIFVNTARGGLVDHEALVWALQTGEIWAAGLDVMTPEPLPVDSVLTTLTNCTLVPHIGSAEVATRLAMAHMAADNLIGALTPGGAMRNQL